MSSLHLNLFFLSYFFLCIRMKGLKRQSMRCLRYMEQGINMVHSPAQSVSCKYNIIVS